MKIKSNLDLLRQMLNTEVNTAMFNPDVNGHTPEDIIIIIKNEDGHIHCISPDNVEVRTEMFKSINYCEYLVSKIQFTEDIVNSLMDHYDKGGTLSVFPTFEEWVSVEKGGGDEQIY